MIAGAWVCLLSPLVAAIGGVVLGTTREKEEEIA